MGKKLELPLIAIIGISVFEGVVPLLQIVKRCESWLQHMIWSGLTSPEMRTKGPLFSKRLCSYEEVLVVPVFTGE